MPFSFRSQATLTSKARIAVRFVSNPNQFRQESPGNSIDVKGIFFVSAAKLFENSPMAEDMLTFRPDLDQLFDSTTSAKRSMRFSAALWPSSV